MTKLFFVQINLDILNYDNNKNTLNLLNSLTSQSLIPIITKPSRITNQTATLMDNIFINQPNEFVSGIFISDISDHLLLFILKRNLFTKKSSQQDTNVKYRLVNDSTITNLRQSLLCLDLNHITGPDNCTTAIWNPQLMLLTIHTSCVVLSNLKHCQTRT